MDAITDRTGDSVGVSAANSVDNRVANADKHGEALASRGSSSSSSSSSAAAAASGGGGADAKVREGARLISQFLAAGVPVLDRTVLTASCLTQRVIGGAEAEGFYITGAGSAGASAGAGAGASSSSAAASAGAGAATVLGSPGVAGGEEASSKEEGRWL